MCSSIDIITSPYTNCGLIQVCLADFKYLAFQYCSLEFEFILVSMYNAKLVASCHAKLTTQRLSLVVKHVLHLA